MKKLKTLWLEAQNFVNQPTRGSRRTTRAATRRLKRGNRRVTRSMTKKPQTRAGHAPVKARPRQKLANRKWNDLKSPHINQDIPDEFQNRFLGKETAEERVQNTLVAKRRLDKFMKTQTPGSTLENFDGSTRAMKKLWRLYRVFEAGHSCRRGRSILETNYL